jgi:hypothetical protein
MANLNTWNTLRFNFTGKMPALMLGITGIQYKEKTESKTHYGVANEPIGYSEGGSEVDGSITATYKQLDEIKRMNRLPDGTISLLKIAPFTVVITNLTEDGMATQSTTTLTNVRFLEDSFDSKQSGGEVTATIPIAFEKIIQK